ncbi:MAG: Fur family transcriptional regulator [Bdellovibrio sp.]
MKKNDSIKNYLQKHHLSVTRARVDIITFMEKNHGPFSVEDLMNQIAGNYDRATLYRNMKSLQECGLVKEVNLGEGFTRYEFVGGHHHHHHHIICRVCQKIKTLDLCFIEKFNQTIKKLGFSDIEHQLEFVGTCSECRS